MCHPGDPRREDKGTASDSREMWMDLDDDGVYHLACSSVRREKDGPPSVFPSVLVSQDSLVLLKKLFS